LAQEGARKRVPSLRSVIAERAAQYGIDGLSDVELVSNVSGASVEASHEAICNAGSLRALLTLASTPSITPAQFTRLRSALEMTRRHYRELMMSGPCLTNPSSTREYLRMKLRDLDHEVFMVLYLDNRNRVISCEQLFRGTIDGATVHPREVVKAALLKNAAAVIFAHNHPSGVAEPSQADEMITRRLKESLAAVDIRVLDHLVIGDGHCESMAERGLL
jgi:DNA repair protein RadC